MPLDPTRATPSKKPKVVIPPRRRQGTPLRARVWTAGRLLLLAGALLFTFAAFFLTAMRVAIRAREVKVPDVRGKSVAEATTQLAQAGLAMKIDPSRRPDATVPADHILTQDPDAGTVIRNQRPIRVRVSDGQRDPTVPAVVGQPATLAEAALASEKVTVAGRAEIRTATYPSDTVVAVDPPAKNRAASVTLLINRGAAGASYVMPDLIGTFGAQAEAILRRNGFRVGSSTHVPYPGIPPGIVVRQSPQAGFQVEYGAPIALEVSQ
jgi:eukaryotic-like serine/threonine-protein kinase